MTDKTQIMFSKLKLIAPRFWVNLFCIILSGSAYSQNPLPAVYSSNVITNSICSWDVKRPLINEADIISSLRTTQEETQTTQYYDGLGRPLQTVAKQVTPLQNDLVTPFIYDSYGREQFKYLPFASNVAQSGDLTNNGIFKM